MTLARLLDIRPGVTAVIGSGGKTTLLRMLGEELAEAGGRVLLCTTTKILPFPGLPCACDRAELDGLAASRLLCAGMPLENGKLTVPEIPVAELAARFDYVLVEADGSARLPLKAHASHEPVIPPEANQNICLVGVSGFGKPIREAAHRPERFAALAGVEVKDNATPENTARVLLAEALADRYLFNQADTPERWEWARRCGECLPWPWAGASLKNGVYFDGCAHKGGGGETICWL